MLDRTPGPQPAAALHRSRSARRRVPAGQGVLQEEQAEHRGDGRGGEHADLGLIQLDPDGERQIGDEQGHREADAREQADPDHAGPAHPGGQAGEPGPDRQPDEADHADRLAQQEPEEGAGRDRVDQRGPTAGQRHAGIEEGEGRHDQEGDVGRQCMLGAVEGAARPFEDLLEVG